MGRSAPSSAPVVVSMTTGTLRELVAQPLEDEQALGAPQLLDRAGAGLRLGGQVGLVLGQQPLFRAGEVQVEDHQVGQGLAPAQHLHRLAVVVGALQRAAAVALFAYLAGDAAVAAGDVVELREVAVAHLHRLVAVIDDEQCAA